MVLPAHNCPAHGCPKWQACDTLRNGRYMTAICEPAASVHRQRFCDEVDNPVSWSTLREGISAVDSVSGTHSEEWIFELGGLRGFPRRLRGFLPRRASTAENQFRVHVGDGGYCDNPSVVSAMEWLLAAGSAIKSHPIYVVLMDSTPGYPPAGQNWTWQRQLVAPLEALQSVRTSSQQARAQFELQLATDFLVSKGFNVKPIRFRYPSDLLTPLSWHFDAGTAEKHWAGVVETWCGAGRAAR